MMNKFVTAAVIGGTALALGVLPAVSAAAAVAPTPIPVPTGPSAPGVPGAPTTGTPVHTPSHHHAPGGHQKGSGKSHRGKAHNGAGHDGKAGAGKTGTGGRSGTGTGGTGTAGHPVAHQPVAHQPGAHKPGTHKPGVHKPVMHRPVHKPVVHKPVVHQPVVRQPVVGKPVTGRPSTGKPIAHKPVSRPVVSPVAGRPTVGKPIVRTPVAGTPTGTPKPASKPLIIGGRNAADSPWAVQVSWDDTGFECSGTAVAPQWVLTARHCVNPAGMTVLIGSNQLGDGTKATVDDKIVDPTADLALLHLTDPVDTTFVTLADTNPKVGAINEIYGWGKTDPTSGPADQLKTAKVKVTSVDCQDAQGGQAICSTGITGTAYNGDSGGPEMESGVEVGVCSTGDDQAKSQQYASVAASRDWIRQVANV